MKYLNVVQNYKYRLYDSKRNRFIDAKLKIAAEIWNHCIALLRMYYRMTGKYISPNRMKVYVTRLKARTKYTHWNELGSQAIQDVVERIGRSYEAFFNHIKGKKNGRKAPPKFKKTSNYSSFTLKQAGWKLHDDNHITLMGKDFRFIKHREMDGIIKTVTVKRTSTGKYFVIFCVERTIVVPDARTGNAVGLDFGLKSFLTTSNNDKIPSPEWYKNALTDIRAAHKNLSHKVKGSNNRRRAKRELALCYEYVSNIREDWFYKLAIDLVKQYDIICIEDLNIDAMKRLWGRKISDLAFSEFVSILKWEALKHGTQVYKVDRFYPSSKTCSCCGYVKHDLVLKDRSWRCPNCGKEHDRDVNAAINILAEGLKSKVPA